jgi:hypothetical protein
MITLVKNELSPTELPEGYRGYQMIKLQLYSDMVIFVNSYIPPTGCKGHERYIQAEDYIELMEETGLEYVVVGDHNDEFDFNH